MCECVCVCVGGGGGSHPGSGSRLTILPALLASNSFDASNSIAPGSIEPILNTCSTAAER